MATDKDKAAQQAADERAAQAAMDAELAKKESRATATTGAAPAPAPSAAQAAAQADAAENQLRATAASNARAAEAARTQREATKEAEDAQAKVKDGGEPPKDADGSPLGAGRKYETKASGSENANGKASATRAGGDPVYSPVIGNPGEANPAAGGYDYALAAASRQPTQRLTASEVMGATAAAEADQTMYARRVVAFKRGEYNGIKEINEEFDNSRNLPPFPDDPKAWFEAVEGSELNESPTKKTASR